jgi:hypothetical protein
MSGWADPSQPSMPGGQPRQSLVGAHHVEVGANREAERLGDLAEHLPVLAGGHHGAADVIGAAKRGYHRGEFDHLRAGAHEDQDVARCGHPRRHHLGLGAACSRPRRRATISRPEIQMNSLLVVR